MIIKTSYDPHRRECIMLIDGMEIARTDYDGTGWEGLELMERIATRVAQVVGAKFENEEVCR